MKEITAADINRLRQQTGAGMMDCKKALIETHGDFEAAIDYLRKKGAKISALRAGREAREGMVVVHTNPSATFGVAVCLNCETDFVARNEAFKQLANDLAQLALTHRPATVEQLMTLSLDGLPVAERIAELVGKIGEKIEISALASCEGPFVVSYVHSNHKLGVLVVLNLPKSEKIEQVGKDLAMQIAAMRPVAVDEKGVPQSLIDRELDIARAKARADGKPEPLIDKIAAGALQKFFKEQTLLNQEFVKDSSKTVAQMLKEADSNLQVLDFRRISTASDQ